MTGSGDVYISPVLHDRLFRARRQGRLGSELGHCTGHRRHGSHPDHPGSCLHAPSRLGSPGQTLHRLQGSGELGMPVYVGLKGRPLPADLAAYLLEMSRADTEVGPTMGIAPVASHSYILSNDREKIKAILDF